MARYIDADAFKDVIQQHDYPLADRLNSIDNGMFTLGIFQAIDQMPTVSPDEVRGVGLNKRADYPSLFTCSVCDFDCDDTYSCSTSNFNYCPNCGAKMEASEDD